MLQLFAQYWTGPVSNTFIILGGIILLYPIIWRLTTKHLVALVQAIEIARKLPDTVATLAMASAKLLEINDHFQTLTGSLEVINEQMVKANRNIDDLQKSAESQPPAAPVDLVVNATTPARQNLSDTELENWEFVSKNWDRVKREIELRISMIKDGRVRKKYNAMSRYSYAEVARILKEDDILTRREADALKEMDEMFRSLKNRRIPVSDSIKRSFEELSKEIEFSASQDENP